MDSAPPALGIVTSLAAELRAAGVRYCHWKSNTTLPEALLGAGDLDLLVHPDDGGRFDEVARAVGFRPTVLHRGVEVPALAHMHGVDEETGRLVHLHVHHRLVLGHDATKNHRLPLEEVFLSTADASGVVPVPPVELEYAVLVLRMVLKYAIADEVVWRAARGRVAGPTPSERAELVDLGGRADRQVLADLVVERLEFLPDGLFDDCERVAHGRAPLVERLRVGRALRHALEAHARLGAGAAIAGRVLGRVRTAWLRRRGRMPRFGFRRGGAIVAVLGGDGAGKSTVIEAIDRWIGDEFDVLRVHVGRPTRSLTTSVVRAVLRLAATVSPVASARVAPSITRDAPTGGLPMLRAVAWHACTARDRHLVHRRARRHADRGWVVIADRYPHQNLSEMDVPQIRRTWPEAAERGLIGVLARLEERYHGRMGTPDVTIVLRVDPDVAVVRKVDEPAEYVHRRSSEVWRGDWRGATTHVVDAGRPAEVVADEVRGIMWSALA